MTTEFAGFPKMARLSREMIVTEKIDGTNAQIFIEPLPADAPFPPHSLGVFDKDGVLHYMAAGSRTRWITPLDDNHGFAAWVARNFEKLKTLPAGRHFGEWWGSGVQRGYGLAKGEKRFSLFNVSRFHLHGEAARDVPTLDPRVVNSTIELPACVGLVPVLYRGPFSTVNAEWVLADLEKTGSQAAPGFMKPEGVVAYHVAGNVGFKKTLAGDEAKGG